MGIGEYLSNFTISMRVMKGLQPAPGHSGTKQHACKGSVAAAVVRRTLMRLYLS